MLSTLARLTVSFGLTMCDQSGLQRVPPLKDSLVPTILIVKLSFIVGSKTYRNSLKIAGDNNSPVREEHPSSKQMVRWFPCQGLNPFFVSVFQL